MKSVAFIFIFVCLKRVKRSTFQTQTFIMTNKNVLLGGKPTEILNPCCLWVIIFACGMLVFIMFTVLASFSGNQLLEGEIHIPPCFPYERMCLDLKSAQLVKG